MNPSHLPEPDARAARQSRLLTERISAAVERAGGWMSFEEYMQLVLHEPGLGYYSAGGAKIGPAGDFITAPELSSLFGRALARQIASILEPLNAPVVVEIGAGTGRLARDILESLNDSGIAPEYRILEPSADLRQRQGAMLGAFGDRVRWLDRWPCAPFDGVIVANEVLDALPVSCFLKNRGSVRPLGVVTHGGRLAWAKGPAQPQLARAVEDLEAKLGRELEEGFRSEISLRLAAWIDSVAQPLLMGAMLLVDYGLVRKDYYDPQRNQGTLICHYRHRAHTDPFALPGLQDLSAWVDFSACADAGHRAGLAVAGFTTQAHFLIESGVMGGMRPIDTRASMAEAEMLKTLVLPGEMGERFKVLMLARGLASPALPGRDFRDRL